MIPATRTRGLRPRNCPSKLLSVIRVRRCHQVRCAVLLTFLEFADILAGGGVPEVAKKVIQIPEKKSTKDKNKGSGSDSSDSDSSDSDSSSKSSTSDGSDAESSPSSSDSSSDSDSSDEEEAKKAPPKTEDKGSSTSESSSDSEDESDSSSQHEEDAPVVKKRKTSENGAAVTTAVASGWQQLARASQGKVKPPLKVRERFQRVKVQNLAPDLLLDNGYEARVGNESSPVGEALITFTARGDERLR
jgi:hypothetical protein